MTNIKLKIKNLIFLIKNKFLAFTAFIWSFTKVTAAFYCAICLLFIFESLREWSTYYIFTNSSLYGLILSALLALALMSLPQNKWRHLFFIAIALPLFAFNLLEIEHYIMFGERVSYASVITMLNTDPRIAAQFVGDSLNLKTCAFENLSDFFVGIRTLAEAFGRTVVNAVFLLEKVKTYIYNIVFTRGVLPHAENLFIFKNECIVL